jgi:pilus assembly protein TadC
MIAVPVLSATLVFVLVAAAAAALYQILFAPQHGCGDRLIERGAKIDAGIPLLRDRPAHAGIAGAMIERMAYCSREGRAQGPKERRLSAALTHAGYAGIDKLIIFRLIQIAVGSMFALSGAFIAWGNGSLGMEIGALFGILGYIVPNSALRRLGIKRQMKIARELPAILDLMVVCLEAGLGLGESLRLVARESARHGGVLGAELRIVAAEMGTGALLANCLHNMAERCGSGEVKNLVALIVQSDQMGTRLGPALRASGEQCAARRRARAEQKAQRSSVHMLVPLVVFILPAMLIVVLGPAFIQVLGLFQN